MGYTYGTQWSDEKVESEIKHIVEVLGIDYFPSHNEIAFVCGNKGLSRRISDFGGSLYWSERTGLPLKKSETLKGNAFEMRAVEDIYEHTNLVAVRMTFKHPYDLLVNGCVKVDVKVSSLTRKKFYTFNLEKKNPTCDLFLLYCLSEEDTLSKTLIVPSCIVVGQSQIGVGEKSKWDNYLNRWDLVTEYESFFNNYKTLDEEKII